MKLLHTKASTAARLFLSALEDQTALASIPGLEATQPRCRNQFNARCRIHHRWGKPVHSHQQGILEYYRLASRSECPAAWPPSTPCLSVSGKGVRLETKKWSGFRALQGESGTTIYSVLKKDTGERWLGSYSFAPIYDKAQTFLGAVVVCRDITEEKAYEQKLLFQRNHDFLTGLYSRVYFENALKQASTMVPFTLLIVDINGLKLVNDSFGHEMGDAVMKKTAQLMRGLCNDDTVVARYGCESLSSCWKQGPPTRLRASSQA